MNVVEKNVHNLYQKNTSKLRGGLVDAKTSPVGFLFPPTNVRSVNQLTADNWDDPGSHSEKQGPTVSMKHCLEAERYKQEMEFQSSVGCVEIIKKWLLHQTFA